jgi:large subunit ribosomal protein L25
MTEMVLKATPRTEAGSATARRMRRDGRIPGVVYGQKKDTVNIELDQRELEAALRRNARVLDVDVGGEVERTLVKELQLDTYGQRIQHIDLLRVVIGETIETEVGLEFFGTPRGVTEENGVLLTPVLSIQIECTPSDIPAAIEVDVRELGVGDQFRAADVVAPEGVKVLEDGDRILATVSAAKEEEEVEEEGLVEGPAEPEVIGRPGEDGEGSGDS